MIKWFHHLFNPHCPECKLEKEDSKICASCESLKSEIAYLRAENQKLIDRLTESSKEEIRVEEPQVPVIPQMLRRPWGVVRQELEKAERNKAAQIRAQKEREINEANQRHQVLVENAKESIQQIDNSFAKSRVVGEDKISDLEKELGVVHAD